jgi:hypothetical protein
MLPDRAETEFATKDDISIIENKIDALNDKLKALSNNKKKETRHESDDE